MSFIRRNLPGLALLLTALCCAAVGLSAGGDEAALAKAIRVCLECVGIG